MDKLSHTDDQGKAAMVNVGGKPVQIRIAEASGRIDLAPNTVALIRQNNIKKGDVLTVAQLAGIQAAKQTGLLIPLCHPLQLDWVEVNCELTETGVTVVSTAQCTSRTGVEMEALTATSVALLTVYDMCKAVDKEMVINGITLERKEKHDCE